jgi:hypothetical protein
VDAAKRLLEFRRDNAAYFDAARALGPQVFTDTVPSLLNSLFVVLAGNAVVHAPAIGGQCPDAPALAVYAQGLVVAAYILLGVLGWYALRPLVTAHIRWPFLLVVAWCGGLAAWTFVGIGAVTDAVNQGCVAKAPVLFGGCGVRPYPPLAPPRLEWCMAAREACGARRDRHKGF